MGDTVGRATTRGERAWSGLGDERAQIFVLSMVSVDVGKVVVDGWAREACRLMLLDVGRRMGEVWGALVWCGPSYEDDCFRRGVLPWFDV